MKRFMLSSWKSLLLISFVVLSLVSPALIRRAFALTTIYLDPPEVSVFNTLPTFQVNLSIADGLDVFGWGVRLTWAVNLMDITTATQGPYLKGTGINTFFTFNPDHLSGFADIACTRLGEIPGVDGDGILSFVTFTVLGGAVGETDIGFAVSNPAKIVHSDLLEEFPPSTGSHVTISGPSPPVAGFTWASDPPTNHSNPSDKPLIVDEPVTFNATYDLIKNIKYGSYDPDGGALTNYNWKFGDGNITDISEPVITHVYTQTGSFNVNLTVTDDEGINASIARPVEIVIVDVGIISVTPSSKTLLQGENSSITVEVKNFGNVSVKQVNMTAYFFNLTFTVKVGEYKSLLVPEPSLGVQTIAITSSTKGIDLGTYTVKVNITDALFGEKNLTNNEFNDGDVEIASFSIIPYSVTINQVTFRGEIMTNSSISRSGGDQSGVTGPVNFNQLNKELSFNATREPGLVGFSNVTIPMKLLNAAPAGWSVLLNGSSISYVATANATHSFIYFTYPHSTNKIQIIGTSVATPPVADFSASDRTPFKGQLIYFNATASIDPDGTIANYTWNFGDGNKTTVTVPIVYHAYQAIQKFSVTLAVLDNDAMNTTETKINYIEVQKRDIAVVSVDVTPTSVPVGDNVGITVKVKNNGDQLETFNVTVFYDDSIIERYLIVNLTAFDFSNPTANENVTMILWDTSEVSGRTYTIRVDATVPSDESPANNVRVGGSVKVLLPPTVEFSVSKSNPNVGETVTFDASDSFDSDGAIVSFGWSFGDGTAIVTETDPVIAHAFAAGGSFTVTLTVTDNDSISDSLSVQVVVAKLSSVLGLSVSKATVTSGEKITLSGTISPARSGVTVTLQYRAVGTTTWTDLGAATTTQDGAYSFEWTTTTAGSFEVRATWIGDAATLGAESSPQSVTVQAPPIDIIWYVAGAGIIAVIAVALLYFFRLRKPKPPQQSGAPETPETPAAPATS